MQIVESLKITLCDVVKPMFFCGFSTHALQQSQRGILLGERREEIPCPRRGNNIGDERPLASL